jgi:hypothetical protein
VAWVNGVKSFCQKGGCAFQQPKSIDARRILYTVVVDSHSECIGVGSGCLVIRFSDELPSLASKHRISEPPPLSCTNSDNIKCQRLDDG